MVKNTEWLKLQKSCAFKTSMKWRNQISDTVSTLSIIKKELFIFTFFSEVTWRDRKKIRFL